MQHHVLNQNCNRLKTNSHTVPLNSKLWTKESSKSKKLVQPAPAAARREAGCGGCRAIFSQQHFKDHCHYLNWSFTGTQVSVQHIPSALTHISCSSMPAPGKRRGRRGSEMFQSYSWSISQVLLSISVITTLKEPWLGRTGLLFSLGRHQNNGKGIRKLN